MTGKPDKEKCEGGSPVAAPEVAAEPLSSEA
jgi:hypothetical protein